MIVAWHAQTTMHTDLVLTPLRMALWSREHQVMWPGLPGERGPGHVIWVLWGLDPSTTDCQGCAHTGHQQYCGKCGIDPDISSGVGKVIPWSTRLLGRVGGFLLRGVLTIGAELMRPLSSSTLSKDITLLGLDRKRHQQLTRVRTGIDDLAINQILHTHNLRTSERVSLGTRLISERHILRSNLHRLRRLTRITRIRVLTIGAELMRPLSSSTLSKDITLHSLGRDRHQPLTRVRTGIDDLAINQILHTLNLRNSERVILGTPHISARHILGSNLHRLRRLTRFTRLQASQILKPGHGELFTLFSHIVLHHVVRDRSILGSNQNVLQRHITFTKIGKVRTLPTKISGVLNVQQF